MPKIPARTVSVRNKTKGTLLAQRVTVADSILRRVIGLLGRKDLEPECGIWIVPANSIHTFGMRFAFDLILIDKHFKVAGLRESIRPFRITLPNFRASSIIELPEQTISKSRTEIGDQLEFVEPDVEVSRKGF